MYHRSDTPFGGTGVNLQAVELREDRVTICPNLVLRILSALLYLCAMLPLGPWLNSRPQPLRPWEVALAFGILTLGLFPLLYVQSRTLTVDENGVEWRALFRMRRLAWREIHDFGLSYAYWGQVRLYFAEERLETNGKGKKRMEGSHAAILIHVQNRSKTGNILNVCRSYTRIRPFLCSEEGRLTGILKDR